MFKGPGSFGAKILITCDPANANHIHNLHLKNYPKGTDFLEIFDILGGGILTSDGESWKTQRKMAFSVVMGQQFQSFLSSSSQKKIETALIPLLNQSAETGSVIDLEEVFHRFIFDTMCTMVLGVDPGTLASDFPTIPFAKATKEAEHILLFRHIVPKFWWKLLRRLDIWQEKKMRIAWEVIDQFIAQSIEKIGHNMSEGSILRPYMDRGYFQSDPKFLRDTLFTFLSAGKDSTGVALSWFFWLVSKNPNVEAKILQELRDQIKCIGDMSLDQLVYLHASLCESLRLCPSIPFNHRQCLHSDVLPSGHKVTSGMEILISIYSMGRMKEIWGSDCLEFRPERWITKEGKLRHEPSYKFLPFGSGQRICLGKDVAFTKMKMVAAAMILNFEIQVVEGHVVEPKVSIVLHMKNGLMVKVKKRLC